MQPSTSLPLMRSGTRRSSRTHPGQSSRQCRGGLPGPGPSGWPRTLRRRCGRRSRRPPARRQPRRPPAWRPRGHAATRSGCWRSSALRPLANVTNRAPTCGPAPSALSARPTPTAPSRQVRAGAGHDADAKTARAGHIPAVRAPTRGEAATGRFALRGIDTRRPKVTRQLDVTKVPRSRDLRRAYRAGLWRLPVQEAQVPRRLSDVQRRRGSWLTRSCLGTELGRQCYRCGRDLGNVHTVIRSVETGSISPACERCA